MAWLITELTKAVSDGELEPSPDLAVWTALVALQVMIWGWVALVNLGIHDRLESGGSTWQSAGFVAVALLLLALPVAIGAAVLLVADTRTSFDSLDVVGGSRSARQAAILTIAGLVSVIPAILVVHSVRTESDSRGWGVNASAVRRIRHLRRSARIAVTSMGAAIAMFIITTSVARNRISERSDAFAVESEHLLLLGGVFTVALLAMFVYAKSAVDRRAEWMLDKALPDVDMRQGKEFVARQKTRLEMGDALGLGVTAWESFQNLVVVASPLLSAILTMFVSART
jgi:hypothetical protein